MGLPFSALNKLGVPGLTSLTTGQVYDRYFKDAKTENFADFHIAFVEFCKYFNVILPGQDFDTPSLEEMKEFFEEWEKEKDAETRKGLFIERMKTNIKVAKVDDRIFILTGLAAPAAAIAAKRAGENYVPQVKKLKLNYVPDVVFVPVCTLLAIIGATAFQMNRRSKPAKQT